MSGNVVRNMPATQFTTNQTRKQARERAHLESRQACEPETMLCNTMLCYGRFTEAVDQASKEAEMKQASKQVGKQASEQARGRVILCQPIYVGGGYCMCALAHRAGPIRNTEWRLQKKCESPLFHHAVRCKLPLPHNAAPVRAPGSQARSPRGNILRE